MILVIIALFFIASNSYYTGQIAKLKEEDGLKAQDSDSYQSKDDEVDTYVKQNKKRDYSGSIKSESGDIVIS